MGNTTQVELDATEIEPGIFVYAEVQVDWDQEVVGYTAHEDYAEPDYQDVYSGAVLDSDVYLADGEDGDEVLIDSGVLFDMAQDRIVHWLLNSREGCAMIESAIEDDCEAAAERWHERSMEARW